MPTKSLGTNWKFCYIFSFKSGLYEIWILETRKINMWLFIYRLFSYNVSGHKGYIASEIEATKIGIWTENF